MISHKYRTDIDSENKKQQMHTFPNTQFYGQEEIIKLAIAVVRIRK